jgi:hypothetical protein
MARHRLRKAIFLLLKVGVSVGLLVWLVSQVRQDDNFVRLWSAEKNWTLLAAAFALCLVSVVITFMRWLLLVRALGLTFHVSDALRLGFLGYLFNFVSLGSVGGDLFKAVFIAREQHGYRAEAVATVLIDRLVGLYGMFLVASAAVLATGMYDYNGSWQIRYVSITALALTLAGAVGIGMLFVPGVTGGWMSRRLGNLPLVGPTAAKLLGAVRIYRQKFPTVLLALAMSIVVHVLLTISLFLIGKGFGVPAPTLPMQFLAVPLAMLTGALPLPFAGLGAFEVALATLYVHTSAGVVTTKTSGLIVALGYRLITIAIAAVGLVYYLLQRREVADVVHEAEEELEREEEEGE